MKILVVDDNEPALYLLQTLLAGEGHEVVTATNGAEALDKARTDLPDLIISDLLMPVMDGYTLLRRWKADEQLKAIPFVVYTATYTEPKDERLALDLRADAFIIKPAEPEPFMAHIHEVLAKHQAGELAPAHAPRAEEKVLLKEYSETLVRKLEDKMLELEQINRALVAEIAERKQAEEKNAQQLTELQRWFDATVDREERMMELKREVDELLARLGEPLRYSNPTEPEPPKQAKTERKT